MLKFLTGVAAIALAASAVHAEPGGGKGGGGKGGGGGHDNHAAAAQGAPGGGHGKGGKADRGGEARGGGDRHAQADSPGKPYGEVKRAAHAAKPDRPAKHDAPRADRADHDMKRDKDLGREVRADVRNDRGRDRDDRDVRLGRGDDVRVVRERFVWDDLPGRGLVDGCPPGLAKKNNGCMPPGQLKNRARLGFFDRPDWWGYDRFDGRYAYHDGSLVRLGAGDRILGYLPLLGGALAPGQLWPSFYEPVALPPYYQDYYGLGQDYRYYDNVLYRVDPETSAITSIAALLTGDDFAVGQPMPLGYDVYNVPYAWRDRYVDGPDAQYRYSDGYIYEVDPTSQLVAAAIQLLT